MTSAEYNEELRKKDNFEKLSAKVISYTPWGTWYPLMKAASDLVLDMLPKMVGIKKSDGSPVIIYKDDSKKGLFTRVLGATVKPQHEYIGNAFRSGNLKDIFGSIFNGGLAKGLTEQFKLSDLELYDISPDEISELLDRGFEPGIVNPPELIMGLSDSEKQKYLALQYKNYDPKLLALGKLPEQNNYNNLPSEPISKELPLLIIFLVLIFIIIK